MFQWWEDFLMRTFKGATLFARDADDRSQVVGRYLAFVKWATVLGILAVAVCFSMGWVYPTLVVLAAMTVVYLPILCVFQAGYEALPTPLQRSLSAWLRRGGSLLLGALVIVVFVESFRLRESREALLILAALGVGVATGWWSVSDRVRKFIGARLLFGLFAIAIAARFPIVSEAFAWAGQKATRFITGVMKPSPGRFVPSSTDELRGALVDQGTGEFLVWYCQDENRDYEFYRAKGYDRFGRPLELADTQTEFDAMIAWQLDKDAEHAQELRRQEAELAQQHAEENARQERQRREAFDEFAENRDAAKDLLLSEDFDGAYLALHRADASIRRHRDLLDVHAVFVAMGELEHIRMDVEAARLERMQIEAAEEAAAIAREAERTRRASYLDVLPDRRVNYIVFAVGSAEGSLREVAAVTATRLSDTAVVSAGYVFSEAFASPAGFDAFFSGRGSDDIVAMELGAVADRLLLIRAAEPVLRVSRASSKVQTYSRSMHAVVIDACDGRKLSEFVLRDISGAGVTESAAHSAFIERFAAAIAARAEVLTGLP